MMRSAPAWIVAISITVGCGRTPLPESSSEPARQLRLPQLQSGDMIFRAGKGRWSAYFSDVSQRDKRFSHVGIIAASESGCLVVHASADDRSGVGTVRADPLESFVSNHDDIAIFRLRVDDVTRNEIAAASLSKCGCRFDSGFDLSTSNEMYCTELVRWSVNSALQREVIGTTTVGGREIVALDDCYVGEWAERIYDSSDNAEPWARGYK